MISKPGRLGFVSILSRIRPVDRILLLWTMRQNRTRASSLPQVSRTSTDTWQSLCMKQFECEPLLSLKISASFTKVGRR